MLNKLSAEKRIAVELYKHSWLDKKRLLSKIPKQFHSGIKFELHALKQMKINNIDELLQLSESLPINKEAIESDSSDFIKLGFSSNFESAIKNIFADKSAFPVAFINAMEKSISQLKKHQTL